MEKEQEAWQPSSTKTMKGIRVAQYGRWINFLISLFYNSLSEKRRKNDPSQVLSHSNLNTQISNYGVQNAYHDGNFNAEKI